GEVERLAVGEHAVAYLEDLRVGVLTGERDGDRVECADRGAGDPLALQQRAHGGQPVALDGSLLELLGRRRGAHPLFQLALDLAIATAVEVDRAIDPLPVFGARDVADTRCRA